MPLRLAFLGTGPFAQASLEALAGAPHAIALLVTQPDRPKGRGHQIQANPLKVWAQERGIEVFQPEKARDEAAVGRILAAKADLHVAVSYGQILPEALLDTPRLGALNIHASLLPKYRGAAPIEWALAHGEAETGVCAQKMVRRLDAGPVYASRRLKIDDDDDGPSLHAKLAKEGAGLLLECLESLEKGVAKAVEQDETAASLAPLLKKADGGADFRLTARQLFDRARAFRARPGFYAARAGLIFKVLRLTIGEGQPGAEPGQPLQEAARGYRVACGAGGSVWIEELLPPAGKPMAAADYARGHRFAADAPWQTPV